MQGLTARPSFYRHALLSAPTRVLQLSTNWRGSCQGVHLQKIAQTIEFPQNAQVELLTADTPFCPLTAMPDTLPPNKRHDGATEACLLLSSTLRFGGCQTLRLIRLSRHKKS